MPEPFRVWVTASAVLLPTRTQLRATGGGVSRRWTASISPTIINAIGARLHVSHVALAAGVEERKERVAESYGRLIGSRTTRRRRLFERIGRGGTPRGPITARSLRRIHQAPLRRR